MVTFRANRTICGDYGIVHAGETFSVVEWAAKDLSHLEASGVIARVTAAARRPVFSVIEAQTQYDTKVIVPAAEAAAYKMKRSKRQ